MTQFDPFKRRYLDSPLSMSLHARYVDLRRECAELEQLVEDSADLSAEEVKELDKAVTVMKVGFKLIKRTLRKRGVTGNLKSPAECATS